MKLFQPITRIPGAQPLSDDEGKPVLDKKRRQVYKMPQPIGFATHWKNAAAPFNKEVHPDAGGTKQVPIYRGMSSLMLREARSRWRRQLRQIEEAKQIAAKLKDLTNDDNLSDNSEGQPVASGASPDNDAATVS